MVTNVSRRRRVERVSILVWLVIGVIQGLLALRFFFKLIEANPDNPVTRFVYGFSESFLFSFSGIAASRMMDGSVIEFSTLIAIVIYAFIGWIFVRLIEAFFFPTDDRPR